MFYMFGRPGNIAKNIAGGDAGRDLGSVNNIRNQILWVRWVSGRRPAAARRSRGHARGRDRMSCVGDELPRCVVAASLGRDP